MSAVATNSTDDAGVQINESPDGDRSRASTKSSAKQSRSWKQELDDATKTATMLQSKMNVMRLPPRVLQQFPGMCTAPGEVSSASSLNAFTSLIAKSFAGIFLKHQQKVFVMKKDVFELYGSRQVVSVWFIYNALFELALLFLSFHGLRRDHHSVPCAGMSTQVCAFFTRKIFMLNLRSPNGSLMCAQC